MKRNITLPEAIEIEAYRAAKAGLSIGSIATRLTNKYGLDYNESLDIARKMKSKVKSVMENPPKDAVLIYDKISAIEAQKGKSSLWPGENFRHDFKKNKTAARIYGLPDGSLLIKSSKGKKLWGRFNYPD